MAVRRKMAAVGMWLLGLVLLGCSSRQIPLQLESIRTKQLVTIETTNGQTISGVVAGESHSAFVLTDPKSDGKFAVIEKTNIRQITGPEPIIDFNGDLVSEQEIDRVKHHVNFTTHVILGGLVSMGASLFVSSLIADQFQMDHPNALVLPGTVAGTIAGAVSFGQTGARQDREIAIEKILTERLQQSLGLPESGASDKLIMERINALRRSRFQQEKEIERLKRELRTMEQPDKN